MPDNLARFERLAQATKMREALARDNQLNPCEQYAREMADKFMRGAEYRRQLESEGPPDGCAVCWQIREAWPWDGCSWGWGHGEMIDPDLRPVDFSADQDGSDIELVEVCMHACHGPEGHYIPVVVYA